MFLIPKFLIICIIPKCVVTTGILARSCDIDKAFEKYKVVPVVISVAPQQCLKLRCQSGLEVRPGDHLTYDEITYPPSEVSWVAEPDIYYAIIELDVVISPRLEITVDAADPPPFRPPPPHNPPPPPSADDHTRGNDDDNVTLTTAANAANDDDVQVAADDAAADAANNSNGDDDDEAPASNADTANDQNDNSLAGAADTANDDEDAGPAAAADTANYDNDDAAPQATVQWMVVNILGNNINDGNTIFKYTWSGPRRGSNFATKVVLLYPQRDKILIDGLSASDMTAVGEPKLILQKFTRKYDLSSYPVSGNVYFVGNTNDRAAADKDGAVVGKVGAVVNKVGSVVSEVGAVVGEVGATVSAVEGVKSNVASSVSDVTYSI